MTGNNEYLELAKTADTNAAKAKGPEERQYWHEMAQKYRAMAAELLRPKSTSAAHLKRGE